MALNALNALDAKDLSQTTALRNRYESLGFLAKISQIRQARRLSTVTISLSETLKVGMDVIVSQHDYSTSSEYVCDRLSDCSQFSKGVFAHSTCFL